MEKISIPVPLKRKALSAPGGAHPAVCNASNERAQAGGQPDRQAGLSAVRHSEARMPIGGELTPQEVIILEEGHEAVLAVVGSIKAKLQASLTKLAISLQDSNATAEVIEEAAKFERLCRELQSNLETTQRLRAYIDARKPALAAAP